jgi:hypothetical protein
LSWGITDPREDTLQYLLLICATEGPDRGGPSKPMPEDGVGWADEMDAKGIRKLGSELRPAATATTVRRRDDETLVADGPFAETKEQIVGFDLIECADLEEAIEVAAKHPVAAVGSIEVRPLWTE